MQCGYFEFQGEMCASAHQVWCGRCPPRLACQSDNSCKCLPGQDCPSAWQRAASPAKGLLSGIWGSSANDVWAVGEEIVHWDGASWSSVTRPVATEYPPALLAVWGSSPEDVWAVGGGGKILHWQGSGWTPVASPSTADLFGIWGSASDDVWAVGAASATSGVILHWQGSAWSQVEIPASGALFGVWGSSASDVWAVGSGGILRWQGTSWSVVRQEVGAWVVCGSAADDVWVLGTSSLLHWQGTQWGSDVVPESEFRGAWCASSKDLRIAGSSSYRGQSRIFRRLDASWSTDSVYDGEWSSDVPYSLRAIWGSSPEDVWAVGDQGSIWHWQ